MIYTNKDCKYQSRLACTLCLQSYHTVEGFQDYFKVTPSTYIKIISNVNNMLDSDVGPYSILHPYFSAKEIELEQVIQ